MGHIILAMFAMLLHHLDTISNLERLLSCWTSIRHWDDFVNMELFRLVPIQASAKLSARGAISWLPHRCFFFCNQASYTTLLITALRTPGKGEVAELVVCGSHRLVEQILTVIDGVRLRLNLDISAS